MLMLSTCNTTLLYYVKVVWQVIIQFQGRGGKGAIYVFSAGNGEAYYEDGNAEGQTRSTFTITIGSVSSDGSPAYYTTPGACVLAATFGGDLHDNDIGIVSIQSLTPDLTVCHFNVIWNSS